MQQAAVARAPWPERRRRAEQLRERYPFAAEVLTLYLALLDVQEPAAEAARTPAPGDVARLARDLLPAVIDVTVAAGPPALAEMVVARFHSADLDGLAGRWLRGAEQSLVDRYLARATTAPFLEMLASPIRGDGPGGDGGRSCPRCGGPPQLSFLALSGEALVTGPRHLLCARCGADWIFPRLVCAGCGEETSARLPVYSESEQFPHLRVDACETCRRYLLAVDLRKDAAAVPVVDELAAIPLALYAKERGLAKVTPNLMGF